MISSPKLSLAHPDRVLECEMALREDNFALLDRGRSVPGEEFQAFARRAQAAGWHPEEIAAAMISLSEKYVDRCLSAHVELTQETVKQAL